MAQGNQVKNGKAFEYAIAKVYCEHINQQGVNAVLVENEACVQARGYYEAFREIDMKDKPDYVLVSVVDLERVLLETNDFPVNSKAEWVDNKIAYYFESEEDLHQSDQVLLNIIYES